MDSERGTLCNLWAAALKGSAPCQHCHMQDQASSTQSLRDCIYIQIIIKMHSMCVQRCFLKFISNYKLIRNANIPLAHCYLSYIFNMQFLKGKLLGEEAQLFQGY